MQKVIQNKLLLSRSIETELISHVQHHHILCINPEVVVLSVFSFLWVFPFPSTSQEHASWTGYATLPLDVNNVCVCIVPCDPIQGVFRPHTQCSQDSLWLHHNPDKNKAAEDE